MSNAYIAVVEDDEDDTDFIRDAIRSHYADVEIKTFNLPREFLAFIEAVQVLPQLVVTDLRMPLVSGFEIIDKLKRSARTKEIPVVVLSTSGNQEDVERARSLGADGYFIKPYSFTEYGTITLQIIRDIRNRFSRFALEFRFAADKILLAGKISLCRFER